MSPGTPLDRAISATIFSLYPLAVFCAGTAVVGWRTRALPLLFLLWTLVTSVHLLRRAWRGPVPAARAEAVARA